MKNPLLFVAIVLACVPQVVLGQAEPKGVRTYTSPAELVSIAPTTTLDKALSVISEVSKKFTGKIIIDTDRRAAPINVDIQGMPWREALETICRKNEIWYTEYENYIQISGTGGSDATKGPGTMGMASLPGMAPVTGIMKETANFRSREVKISAVFFTVDIDKLTEVGINWSFMKSTSNVDLAANFAGADPVTSQIFKLDVTPKLTFANMNFVAKVFSNYSLGELLSGPQIVVRSGEEGRIQVGQDFSIRERDFAGNLIDKFYSAGVIVKVTPQVITEQGVNFVHLVVDVERSAVQPGAISTIINKSKANTNLLLLDGEETIIGGLYHSETSTVRQGVPFFKDLPWYVFGLRYLFGYDKDQVIKKELIILIKVDLVPTLQERITQKTKEGGLFDRWLDEQMKREEHITGKVSQ